MKEQKTKHQLWGAEDGATLIEFAVVFPLVILVVMGALEFSLAFKDWLTVSHASRAAVSAAATAANDVTADIEILEAVEEAFLTGFDGLDSVVVSDPDSGLSTTYVFTGNPICRWSPCPDPFAGPVDFGPPYQQPAYLPSSRDVSAPNVGRVQVDITMTHDWVTGMIGSSTVWTSSVVTRLEPRVFE